MAAGDDAVLQTVLDRLTEAGFAAEVWDRDWRLFGVTDDYRVMISGPSEAPAVGEGLHFLEPAM